MQFKKKPVVIEAVQWRKGDAPQPRMNPYGGSVLEQFPQYEGFYFIETLEGNHHVSDGDWIITGIKGEHYPCKPDIFAASYDAVAGASAGFVNGCFGDAIAHLKAGGRVARAGWNGKGMWLSLSCDGSREIPAESFWSPHNAEFARENGGKATVLPSITMKTATDEILMGWLASQTDMLANDWQSV